MSVAFHVQLVKCSLSQPWVANWVGRIILKGVTFELPYSFIVCAFDDNSNKKRKEKGFMLHASSLNGHKLFH